MILSMVIFAAFVLAAVLAHHLRRDTAGRSTAIAHAPVPTPDPARPPRPTDSFDDDRPELAWTALDDQQLNRLLRGST